MTVSLRLSDGTDFLVHMDFDELTHKLRSALDENQFFEVKTAGGSLWRVNPHHVLFLELVLPLSDST